MYDNSTGDDLAICILERENGRAGLHRLGWPYSNNTGLWRRGLGGYADAVATSLRAAESYHSFSCFSL